MWQHAASAFLGYCLAAMCSSYVSLSLSLTVWGSAWTYFVLLFWWLIGYFALIPVLFIIFGGGFAAIFGILLGLGLIAEKVKR